MEEENEIWRPVVGFEGSYKVSNLGRIKSIDRENKYQANGKTIKRYIKGTVLKQQFDGRKLYLHVQLRENGKNKVALVHRVVAEAFVDNPNNLPEVNHKDENKINNQAKNLEWCDHKYNNNYGSKKFASRGERNGAAKLTPEIVLSIRKEFIPHDKEHGITGIAEKYGISVVHAHQIVFRKRWGWLD